MFNVKNILRIYIYNLYVLRCIIYIVCIICLVYNLKLLKKKFELTNTHHSLFLASNAICVCVCVCVCV